MQLVQQKGRKKKTYVLTASGLRIRTGAGGLSTEETVPFEHIRPDRFVYQQVSYGYLACAGVFFLIAVLVLLDRGVEPRSFDTPLRVWTLIALASLVLFFLHRPKRYYLKTFTGRYIRFRTGCDDTALEAFVEALLQQRSIYLRLKYTALSVHLSYEGQYSNLNILHREGVLTTEEYSGKIAELNALFRQTVPRQTFSTFSQN